MNELIYVKRQLEKRSKQLGIVSFNTGLSLRTINYIRGGRDAKYTTVMCLYEYLKANAKKKELDVE